MRVLFFERFFLEMDVSRRRNYGKQGRLASPVIHRTPGIRVNRAQSERCGGSKRADQELVQCAVSYVISRIRLVIPWHHSTTCSTNIDRHCPIHRVRVSYCTRYDIRLIALILVWSKLAPLRRQCQGIGQSVPTMIAVNVRWYRHLSILYLCMFNERWHTFTSATFIENLGRHLPYATRIFMTFALCWCISNKLISNNKQLLERIHNL